MSLTTGAEIDGFVLQRELGSGAHGTVWAAVHAATKASYALKLLDEASSPRDRERFRREVEALARVDGHANLVRVHTAGTWRGQPYVVMEQLGGGDLRDRLRRGRLSAAEAAALVEGLARGLAHAHALGVLHRDIKPGNVLFDDAGVPKLADFGLAGSATTHSLTQTGQLLGTPAYMPPEQVTGNVGQIDARSDVYALGALLYEVLTGELPFPATDLMRLAVQIVNARPTPPRELVRGVPPALEAICLRALAKDPADRFPSARALADALAAFQAEAGEERAARSKALGLALVGAALVVGVLAWGVGRGPTEPTPPTVAAATSAPPRPTRSPSRSPSPPPPSPPTPSARPQPRPVETLPTSRDLQTLALEMLSDSEKTARLAAAGDPVANRHLATIANRRRDWPTAVKHYLVLAAQGDREAIHELSLIYLDGKPGVPQDVPQGLKWCERAAALGDAQSMAVIARHLALGDGVPRNLKTARIWLGRLRAQEGLKAKLAAAQLMIDHTGLGSEAEARKLLEPGVAAGDKDAYYLLGKLALRRGDVVEGRKWLRAAVARGSRRGTEKLYLDLLLRGPSAAERAEAIELMRRSASTHGSVDSMVRLAKVLLESPAEADRAEAVRHLRRAAGKGSEEAKALLRRQR